MKLGLLAPKFVQSRILCTNRYGIPSVFCYGRKRTRSRCLSPYHGRAAHLCTKTGSGRYGELTVPRLKRLLSGPHDDQTSEEPKEDAELRSLLRTLKQMNIPPEQVFEFAPLESGMSIDFILESFEFLNTLVDVRPSLPMLEVAMRGILRNSVHTINSDVARLMTSYMGHTSWGEFIRSNLRYDEADLWEFIQYNQAWFAADPFSPSKLLFTRDVSLLSGIHVPPAALPLSAYREKFYYYGSGYTSEYLRQQADDLRADIADDKSLKVPMYVCHRVMKDDPPDRADTLREIQLFTEVYDRLRHQLQCADERRYRRLSSLFLSRRHVERLGYLMPVLQDASSLDAILPHKSVWTILPRWLTEIVDAVTPDKDVVTHFDVNVKEFLDLVDKRESRNWRKNAVREIITGLFKTCDDGQMRRLPKSVVDDIGEAGREAVLERVLVLDQFGFTLDDLSTCVMCLAFPPEVLREHLAQLHAHANQVMGWQTTKERVMEQDRTLLLNILVYYMEM